MARLGPMLRSYSGSAQGRAMRHARLRGPFGGRAVRGGPPSAVVGHHRENALVQAGIAEIAERLGDSRKQRRAAVVRVPQAEAVAEFVDKVTKP
jgi:hypothetical protein